MRIISVNVGQAREVRYRGRAIRTAIFKEPVAGPVEVGALSLAGDVQADRRYHGGRDKAVYVYPAEHYAWWATELGRELTWGAFGENLTTLGLDESAIHVGDEIRVGSARLVVTEPRIPCFKLGLRFDDPLMPKRFAAAGRSGFYCAVLEPGAVQAGDPLEVAARRDDQVTIAELFQLMLARQ